MRPPDEKGIDSSKFLRGSFAVREAGNQPAESGSGFESGQCRTEAEVFSKPKAEMSLGVSCDVEAVRIFEATFVVVRRTDESHYDATGGDSRAGDLGFARRFTKNHLNR